MNLLILANELNAYKNDRQEFLIQCIRNRLQKSFNSYIKELQDCARGIDYTNDIRILRKINKL